MYSIRIEADFSAAHNLRGYSGKCERLHGHNWRVEVIIASDDLDELGMVMDFREARDALSGVLSKFDHRYLNEIPYFKKKNPSSEVIARYVFEELRKKIRRPGRTVRRVIVWETERSCAAYTED